MTDIDSVISTFEKLRHFWYMHCGCKFSSVWWQMANDSVLLWTSCDSLQYSYIQTSKIRATLVSNKIVDHSDVVGASPVGAAPTTSSFPAEPLASTVWAKTTARQDKKHLKCWFGSSYTIVLMVRFFKSPSIIKFWFSTVSAKVEYRTYFEITKDTPSLTHKGERWNVYCEYLDCLMMELRLTIAWSRWDWEACPRSYMDHHSMDPTSQPSHLLLTKCTVCIETCRYYAGPL